MMSHDVFISYATKDKNIADAVCNFLEGQRIRCWIAPRDVTPGLQWAEQIVRAIDNARLMILIFSRHSNDSTTVLNEVQRAAVRNGIPVVTFRTEEIEPADAMSLYLGALHWLDAIPPTAERTLKKLADDVRLLLTSSTKKHREDAVDCNDQIGKRERFGARAWVVLVGTFALLTISVVLFLPRLTTIPKSDTIIIGGKLFLESSVLLEMMAAVIKTEHKGVNIEKKHYFKQSNRIFQALRKNDLHIFAEYSGTILVDHLDKGIDAGRDADLHTSAAINELLATAEPTAIRMLKQFGFNNPYRLVMLRDVAAGKDFDIIKNGRTSISDLANVDEKLLTLGSDKDFDLRPDGVDGLEKRYGLSFGDHYSLEHVEKYDKLQAGKVNVIDGYATDVALLDARYIQLDDDQNLFGYYWAAPLIRADMISNDVQKSLNKLAGSVDESEMRQLLKDAKAEIDIVELKANNQDEVAKLAHLVSKFLAKKNIIPNADISPAPVELRGPIVNILSPENNLEVLSSLIYEWELPDGISPRGRSRLLRRLKGRDETIIKQNTQKTRWEEDKLEGDIEWKIQVIPKGSNEPAGKGTKWQSVEYYSDTWARICATKTVSVGVGKLDKLFIFEGKDGEIHGPEVDLLRKLVRSALDKDEKCAKGAVRVQSGAYIAWGKVFFNLLNKNVSIDLLASRISITPDRMRIYKIEFTIPYIEYPQSVIMHSKRAAYKNGIFDLRILGAQAETTNAELAQALLGSDVPKVETEGKWSPTEGSATGDQRLLVLWKGDETDVDELNALLDGKIDGIVADQPYAMKLVSDASAKGYELKREDISPGIIPGLESEKIGFAIRKSDARLREALNIAIQEHPNYIKDFEAQVFAGR